MCMLFWTLLSSSKRIDPDTVDSNSRNMDVGCSSFPSCRMIYAGRPSFLGLGLLNSHVLTFWLLLEMTWLGFSVSKGASTTGQ